MLRKSIVLITLVAMMLLLVVGCGGGDGGATPQAPQSGGDQANPADPASEVNIKVGMVTDAGTIDDKSFNQGTWEGIQIAASEFGFESRYLRPSGETEADYLREIGNLVDAGFTLIVTPGFKFETAIFQAQERYSDVKFVLLDGSPHAGDWSPVVGDNTVSIFFAEHQSGFLAGVATALQLQEGDLGYIGGMEIPPVQKFNWGFQQGVTYANENYDTNMTIKSENVIYQGSFDNIAAGQQLAAQMYDRNVKAIFAAAGSVGLGVINESKARMVAGNDAWVIGVDVDQYDEGLFDGTRSSILTSAMKKIDQSSYDMIVAEIEGNFPGGEILTFEAANFGVGIPENNPNLDADVEAKVAEVFELIKSGAISVADEQGDLIK